MPDPQPSTASAPLGNREHVRRTLERARKTVAAARAQKATSHSLLARAAELLDRGERAVELSFDLRAQLRESVTAYVTALRAEETPPQRVLVLVKTAVREATPPELDAYEARDLMEDVVRWAVEAYYPAA